MRAARALTAYLSVVGELPLNHAQVNLIRALELIESASHDPVGDAVQVMGMVARFYTPMQLEFAAELLAEGLTGVEGEGAAIMDELAIIAREGGALQKAAVRTTAFAAE